MLRALFLENTRPTRRRLFWGSQINVTTTEKIRSTEENGVEVEATTLTTESEMELNATGGTDEEEVFVGEDTDDEPVNGTSTEEPGGSDVGVVTSTTLDEQEAIDDNGEEEEEAFVANEEEIEETLEEWEEATEVHDAEWFAEFDATHNFTEYGFVEYGDDEDEDEDEDDSIGGKGEETIEEIEEELKKEEEQAELAYEAEDAELDAEGYIDGTEPITNGDEFEPTIEPMDGTNSTTVDDEKEELEAWEEDAIEEWKEAEEEHEEWENEHTTKPDGETDTETETDDSKGQNANNDDDANDDDANDDDQSDNHGEIANDDDQTEPDQVLVKNDDEPGWTGETDDETVKVDTDDDNLVPSPVSSPTGIPSVASPTFSPIEPPKIADCSGVVGQLQCGYEQHSFVVYALVAFIPLFLMCCLRKYCCRSKSGADTRGEYRAVAAQYGDMGYDNTFSDNFSDDEDDDFVNGNGDIEDDSWGKSGKRTLELTKLGKERNGGLSLEEMNG